MTHAAGWFSESAARTHPANLDGYLPLPARTRRARPTVKSVLRAGTVGRAQRTVFCPASHSDRISPSMREAHQHLALAVSAQSRSRLQRTDHARHEARPFFLWPLAFPCNKSWPVTTTDLLRPRIRLLLPYSPSRHHRRCSSTSTALGPRYTGSSTSWTLATCPRRQTF
jgi:hypothetical protein